MAKGGLADFLAREQRRLGWSLRDMAEAIGISHATVKRLLDGYPADQETLEKIYSWSHVTPTTFLKLLGFDVSAVENDVVREVARLRLVGEKHREAMSLAGQLDDDRLSIAIEFLRFQANR